MGPKVIQFTGANGSYGFCSNFYPAVFLYRGWVWDDVEHAYQAEKSLIQAQRRMVHEASTPGKAKRLGRKITLRSDWNQVKDQSMLDICLKKFTQNKDLAAMLVSTGDAILVEHTPWKDYYWGDGGDGTGQNKLGRILMAIRSYLNVYQETTDEDDEG